MSRSFANLSERKATPNTPFSMTVWIPRDIWIASRATVPNGYAGIPPCLKRSMSEYPSIPAAVFDLVPETMLG